MGQPSPDEPASRRTSMAIGRTVLEGDVIHDHETARRAMPIAITVRRLQMCGFSPVEAATLAGRLTGLPVTRSGWTARQVEYLVFLRAIVESGRLGA
jgi:hypothetical protein